MMNLYLPGYDKFLFARASLYDICSVFLWCSCRFIFELGFFIFLVSFSKGIEYWRGFFCLPVYFGFFVLYFVIYLCFFAFAVVSYFCEFCALFVRVLLFLLFLGCGFF